MNPCPACRKNEGKHVELGAGRFRHAIDCAACGFQTAYVRTKGIAEKLWNNAKKRGA